MSGIRISHSPDLQKLEAEGYRLRIIDGSAAHLLVEGIPAVTAAKTVKKGTLYCPLETDQNERTKSPIDNHQCWWIGDPPCDADGVVMEYMISNPAELKGDGIQTTVGFSRKKPNNEKYRDHYEKVTTYVQLIWHEAKAIDPDCDPRSEKPIKAVVEAQERIFHYPDMATTRAGIGAATGHLMANRVAIIGLGGTGSYILDLLAKTPIGELHIFDGDDFSLHNAFRSPGAPAKDELKDTKKVDWFGAIYDKMRREIKRHPYYVDETNLDELNGFDFVFVAIDSAKARKPIVEGLISRKIPFVDVGMDLGLVGSGGLRGIARYTVGLPDFNAHVTEVISLGVGEDDGVYRNIQVADINMLNAAMAVMKWKKMRGFYEDDIREHHSIYTISTNALTKEDRR